MSVRAKIIDTGAGLKAPSFKKYKVDAKGNTTIESWTPPARKQGMKRVMERVKRGADGAGILFEYSIDDEDIVTYSEKEYKALPNPQKAGLIFDDNLKLWYRLESVVYLKFGPYGQKGWKVLARLEPVNETTEKDRRWPAINVLPFPGVPDSEIYPYLPKIADEASRCDACQNLRYRTDTYLLVSPKGKHEIVGTTCLLGYTGLDPRVLLDLYAALDPTKRYRAGKSASPRNLKVANKDFTQFMLLLSRWVVEHGYTEFAPGVTPRTKRSGYYRRSYQAGLKLGEFLFQGFALPAGMKLEVDMVPEATYEKYKDEYKAAGKQMTNVSGIVIPEEKYDWKTKTQVLTGKNLSFYSYELEGPLFVSEKWIPYKLAAEDDKKVVKVHTDLMNYVKNMTPANSYQINIKSMFNTGEVTRKIASLAASIYQSYQNFLNPPPSPPKKPKPSPARGGGGRYHTRATTPTVGQLYVRNIQCFGNPGEAHTLQIKVTTCRSMTSQAGNHFQLFKGDAVNQGNKKVTWFADVNDPLVSIAMVMLGVRGATIDVEAVIKQCSEYRGVWSTQLQDVRQLGKAQSSSYISKPGQIIKERVHILSSKDATYGGKEIQMETAIVSGSKQFPKKLIAYDQHSELQLANPGEVWNITAKVKKHYRGMTQIYYISTATKV